MFRVSHISRRAVVNNITLCRRIILQCDKVAIKSGSDIIRRKNAKFIYQLISGISGVAVKVAVADSSLSHSSQTPPILTVAVVDCPAISAVVAL
jgi:hypothetical protein